MNQRLLSFVLLVASTASCAMAQAAKTRNVVIITTDGFRWQEIFHGADPEMLSAKTPAMQKLRDSYTPGTQEQNRTALMPFFWGVVAKQGQIFGDRDLHSNVNVQNGFNFSYPGYNEMLTGRPNPEINTNEFPDNTRATVFEWLNDKPAFHGKVAAFALWKPFEHILRRSKSGLPVTVAYEPLVLSPMTQELKTLNAVKISLPKIFGEDESLDAPVVHQAMAYVRAKKPRVLYIACGETDLWAHRGDYPAYLEAAHRYDDYLRLVWEMLQSMPEYRGNTTLVMATDHGRGTGKQWTGHASNYAGSENIWTAYLGPDTQSLGLRHDVPDLAQGQLAATVARLLGENFAATDTTITPAITEVLPGGKEK